MAVRITCINKPSGNLQNPHEAISHFGWINEQNNESGKSTREEMVRWLKIQGNKAYVKDLYGNVAYCGVRASSRGVEFLQTYTDRTYTDNLLSLKECPIL